ncbi:MAG: 16S rRNA processing protein RimM [Acidobacteria bacterium]|nr:16S rRNA processing protein RimM [Acidobacteriota bacterium]MBI3663918.1 16S rRNA processing protein RimM [Acidobacteriota bacterium]
MAQEWQGVTLARILRSRGRIGEVAAEILTDFPQRLTALREVYLSDGKKPPRRVAVRRCWLHKGQAIFHFENVDSISAAETLKGLEIQVPLSERVTLPAGQYFFSDLIGCEVREAGASTPLGVVRDVQPIGENTPGAPLLVVDTPQGEMLIPFAQEICTRIDLAARRIDVLLPDGLRELSLSAASSQLSVRTTSKHRTCG